MVTSTFQKITSTRAILGLIACILLCCFLFFAQWYQEEILKEEIASVKNHAKVISASLWQYEKQTPKDYLTLAVESNGYQKVIVTDDFGREFLQVTGTAPSSTTQFLLAIHLLYVQELEAPITFSNRHIGTITVSWICDSIYLYCYILFCLLLLLCAIGLYLKLLDAKRSLETRVANRTAALEQEVADRKKAEKQQRYQAQRLSAHVQQTPLGVVECSADLHVVEWNQAAERIFGYTRAEMIGKDPLPYILRIEGEEAVRQHWTGLLATGIAERIESEHLHKDGSLRICTWYSTPLPDPDGTVVGVASLVLDITEQVKTEEKNKLLHEQLLQAQKMEAVGNLAGGIAHDFNNLLQSISGYTQLLLIDSRPESHDYTRLKGIETAANRAAELIGQMLTFSRKIESKLIPLHLNDEIRHIRRLLDRTIPKMVHIKMNLEPGLFLINADSIQIEQIVLNLAINANQAMEGQGSLRIETANVTLEKDFCRTYLGTQEGPNVMLRISDTGKGMDKDTVARIFEPFFTTKETGQGTGLGLASVYGIIQAHNASIHCQSEPEKGTVFTIYFPALDKDVVPPVSSFKESDQLDLPGGSETILLIDDEQNILEIGRDILQAHGYTVLTASSGEEGLETYSNQQQAIDIIIMDLNMPGMGGFKCMEAIKEINPQVHILIASGYTPTSFLQKANALGATGVLSKPFQMDAFLRKIRAVLDKPTPCTNMITSLHPRPEPLSSLGKNYDTTC